KISVQWQSDESFPDGPVNAACTGPALSLDSHLDTAVSIRDSMNQHLAAKEPSASRAWLRALEMTARIEDAPARVFPVVVEELGARFGPAPAIIGSDATWSHAQLAARANRYARWALAQGIAAGDTVALLLGNCPDYLAIWLGITRIGGLAALINTNLSGEAL